MAICRTSVTGHVMAGVKSSGPIRIVGGLAGSSVLCQSSANKLSAVSSQPQMLARSQPSSGNGTGPFARTRATNSSISSTAANLRLPECLSAGGLHALVFGVELAGCFQHAFGGPYLWLGRLQD